MTATNIARGERLQTPMHIRASSANNQFVGATVLGSGSATVVVSTTAVKSNSMFFLGAHSLTDQASGVAAAFEVRTIVHGGYFVLSNSDGIADARDATIFWMIVNR